MMSHQNGNGWNIDVYNNDSKLSEGASCDTGNWVYDFENNITQYCDLKKNDNN